MMQNFIKPTMINDSNMIKKNIKFNKKNQKLPFKICSIILNLSQIYVFPEYVSLNHIKTPLCIILPQKYIYKMSTYKNN